MHSEASNRITGIGIVMYDMFNDWVASLAAMQHISARGCIIRCGIGEGRTTMAGNDPDNAT